MIILVGFFAIDLTEVLKLFLNSGYLITQLRKKVFLHALCFERIREIFFPFKSGIFLTVRS